MSKSTKRYEMTLTWTNDGEVYGTNQIEVEAANKTEALERARKMAANSIYDDDRIPDRCVGIKVDRVFVQPEQMFASKAPGMRG